jgi:hypothetical protein
MPLTVDRKVHEMRAECDGAKTPLHCDVAKAACGRTRTECIAYLEKAGWVFDAASGRWLCAACHSRECGK